MNKLTSRTRAIVLASLLVASAFAGVATSAVAGGSTIAGDAQQAPNGSNDNGTNHGVNETTTTPEGTSTEHTTRTARDENTTTSVDDGTGSTTTLATSTTAEGSPEGTGDGDRRSDGDNVRTNATPIEPNEFVEGTIDEGDEDGRDVDWYRFDVAAGDHLRVVSFEGYGVGSSYTLYSPDGTVLGSGEEYGTEDAPVAGTADAAGGTYYLEVTVDDGLVGEPYGFSVESAAPDPFEPNEKRDEAVPIESGAVRSGVIAAGDTDWFAIDVTAGETFNATLELTDTRSLGYIGDNNADLDIYDPGGNEVGENPEDVSTRNAPADQTSRFDGRFEVVQRTVAEESGTYYVRATGVDTTGFTQYDLTTAVSSADDGNGSDGNNGDGESAPFENATVVDSISAIGSGQIDTDGNADIYAFEMREGSQVELSQGSGGGAYPVTVLGEDGRVLGRIADQDIYRGEEDLLRANASYTGTYYLKIDGDSGDRYSILGSITEPDANEPNDERERATEIVVGGIDRGTIVRGDTDYYAVSLDAGETVDVFADSTAVAALTVYGPSGSAIDSMEVPSRFDGDTGAPITSVTADESGTYYLELSIRSNAIGRVGGEYAIELKSAGGADDHQSNGVPSSGEAGGDASNDEDTVGDETTTGGAPANADGSTTDEGSATDTGADETSSAVGTTEDSSNETGEQANGTGEIAPSGGAEKTAVDGPGFGLLAALLAVLGAGVFAIGRD